MATFSRYTIAGQSYKIYIAFILGMISILIMQNGIRIMMVNTDNIYTEPPTSSIRMEEERDYKVVQLITTSLQPSKSSKPSQVTTTPIAHPQLGNVLTLDSPQPRVEPSRYPTDFTKLPYLDQIEKDLKPFSNNITLDLIHYVQKFDYTVRVQYINQTLYSYPIENQRRNEIGKDQDSHSRTNDFVKLIKNAVNLYQTPDFDMVINLHDGPRACGQYVGSPIFSFQKTDACSDLLLPCALHPVLGTKHYDDDIQRISTIGKNYSWSQKINKIIWRGSGTGGIWDNTNLHTMVRFRIFVECDKLELKDVCDIGLLNLNQVKDGVTINDPRIIFRERIPFDDWMKYKYELVLDGNGSPAGRIERQLAHNSLLLMQESDNYQMYTRYLKPFVHYVPLQNNVSNLVAAYQWARDNEEKVLNIIQSANDFAQLLKHESILYYTHILLSNYSSRLSFRPQLEPGYNITVWSIL